MPKIPVYFYSQNVSFAPRKKNNLREWLQNVAIKERAELKHVNFIFCNDEYLLSLNETYLNHKTYTDIITFDYSEKKLLRKGSKEYHRLLSGDIFVSIDRIKENALKFNTGFENELHRVMVHGILHLIGYKDKARKEKLVMTEKENLYISLNNSTH